MASNSCIAMPEQILCPWKKKRSQNSDEEGKGASIDRWRTWANSFEMLRLEKGTLEKVDTKWRYNCILISFGHNLRQNRFEDVDIFAVAFQTCFNIACLRKLLGNDEEEFLWGQCPPLWLHDGNPRHVGAVSGHLLLLGEDRDMNRCQTALKPLSRVFPHGFFSLII